MAVRVPSLVHQPIGFAHRGARAHAEENTVEAFDLALRLGATGIESDVWLTNDGELILNHDGVVGIRRKKLAKTSRDQLPDNWITLPELLDRTSGEIELSIDIKDDAAIDPILSWVEGLGQVDAARVWLCHPDWQTLRTMRARNKDLRLVDSTALKHMTEGPERRAARLAEAGIDAVNLRQSEWTSGMVTLFHRFEIFCFGWDAHHRRLVDELLVKGIDAIFSDHVDVLMEAITTDLARRDR